MLRWQMDAELVENRAGALAEGGDYKRLNQREWITVLEAAEWTREK